MEMKAMYSKDNLIGEGFVRRFVRPPSIRSDPTPDIATTVGHGARLRWNVLRSRTKHTGAVQRVM